MVSFWARKRSPDGRAPYCKSCFSRRNAEAYDRRIQRDGAARQRPYSQLREVPDGTKWCPGCEALLPIDDFVINRSQPSGIGGYCRPCQNAKAKESRERVHGGSRHYHLVRRYGIGAAEVDAILEAQGSACPICLRPLTAKDAHVDHDHASGAVRGVLCFTCNSGLGGSRDTPEALRRAAAYLEGAQWRSTGTAPGDSPPPS